MRRPLLEISLEPDAARAHGRRLRWWDFFFYITFGIVVTSSVRIAGVLLVFSYLIVPAAVAALLTASVPARLLIGWGVGALVSAAGLWASFAWDLPTGAAVVTSFGALMALVAIALGVRILARRVRERGMDALRGAGVLLCLSLALAGLLLALLPGMDHLWLDWLEEAAPAVRLAFLTPGERAAHRDSREALERGTAELARLRALQQDVQWGARADARRAAGAPAPVPRLPRGDRGGRPDGAGHAAGPCARAASASGSGPRCSCWARRAPRGWASGRGHGAAGRIRIRRSSTPSAVGRRLPALRELTRPARNRGQAQPAFPAPRAPPPCTPTAYRAYSGLGKPTRRAVSRAALAAWVFGALHLHRVEATSRTMNPRARLFVAWAFVAKGSRPGT